MKKHVKNTVKAFLCIICSIVLFFQGTVDVFAINTHFDVPTIEADWTPDNCLYKSPNLNIQVCNWGYGLVADVLNTSSVDTLLAELHANISPAGYKRSILGIYMEGASLSEANASAIANAGWTEMDLYYETFFVGGSVPTGAMAPSVAMTTNESAMTILNGAGITEDIAMIKVSDVNMTWANFILYEPEFKFLKGKSLYSYKYITDLGVFVPITETYFGAYGANFLELYDLQKAEADVNGIYVTLTKVLPENMVVSAEEVHVLRESLAVTPPSDTIPTEPADESGNNDAFVEGNGTEETIEETTGETEDATIEETTEANDSGAVKDEEDQADQAVEQENSGQETVSDSQEPDEPEEGTIEDALVVSNIEKNVEWKFSDGQMPESFTAEATVQAISETEVSVDFAFSGLLPQNTEVTVQIPSDSVNYSEGDTLYFYYCNPETGSREFVSEGKYTGKQVTFSIHHCSEYVITSAAPTESGEADKEMPLWLPLLLVGAVACGIFGFVAVKKKRR